jgi:hypothetical protein
MVEKTKLMLYDGAMKRTVLVLALIIVTFGIAWTQEAEKVQPAQSAPQAAEAPKAAVSVQACGSMVAPFGVEAEFFMGSVGLSVETRLFVRKLGGELVGVLEPGINLRIYFSELDSSLFFFTGADFLMVWDLKPVVLEQGIVKPRAGLGYQRLLGKSRKWRLGLEIGAAWLQEVVEGDQGDLYDPVLPLLPHVLLVLGRAF